MCLAATWWTRSGHIGGAGLDVGRALDQMPSPHLAGLPGGGRAESHAPAQFAPVRGMERAQFGTDLHRVRSVAPCCPTPPPIRSWPISGGSAETMPPCSPPSCWRSAGPSASPVRSTLLVHERQMLACPELRVHRPPRERPALRPLARLAALDSVLQPQRVSSSSSSSGRRSPRILMVPRGAGARTAVPASAPQGHRSRAGSRGTPRNLAPE